MSKYIDADALKRWIQMECNPYGRPTMPYGVGCRIMNYIDNMPAADVETVKKWISVDERLSEKFEECIVAKANGEVRTGAYYNKGTQKWVWDCIVSWAEIKDVVAWMPLPEPPKMDGGNE